METVPATSSRINLSTEQIRDLCTNEVFDRARNYRDEERTDRFDETVSAAVQGSRAE